MKSNEIISSGLLELYVLGMTNEQETAEVIAMTEQYPEIKLEIVSIEHALEKYAHSYAVAPSPGLKDQVLNPLKISDESKPGISKTSNKAPVVSISSFWKYAAAASIILLIGSSILNINYYAKYTAVSTENAAVIKEKSALEQQLFAKEQQNNVMKNDMSVIQSKYSEPVALRGLPASPQSVAKIFWMKNTGEVYIDPSNLPDAPEGMQYQLWGIVDGKPVDGGMIITNSREDKYRIQKMKTFGKAEAFAVTLETKGGNPTPKGEMYVMGKI